MVYKQSEYRRQFRRKNFVDNIPTYRDNVSYRTTRRETEQSHTPFSWEGDEEMDLPSVYSDEQDDTAHIMSKDDHKKGSSSDRLLHDLEDRNDLRLNIEDLQLSDDRKYEYGVTGHAQGSPSKDRPGAKTFKIIENGCGHLSDANNNAVKKSSVPRPRKSKLLPHRTTRIERLCTQKASSSHAQGVKKRPAKDLKDERPPFAQFGWADSQRETGKLRTHNIKASSAVYGSAIKALRKKQVESDQQEMLAKRAARGRLKAQDLYELALSNQPSSWETEYRRNFPVYEPSQYHSHRSFRPYHPKEFLPAK